MTSICGKNKRVAHELITECDTDVLTALASSVIYYWTDTQQHWIYLVSIVKKQKDFFFISKSLANITRKPAFAHFRKHEKEPFDVIRCLYKIKHLIGCYTKQRIMIGPGKSRHCHVWIELSLFVEWNGKLAAKAELNCKIYKSQWKCWKNQVSLRHQSTEPCKLKSVEVALNNNRNRKFSERSTLVKLLNEGRVVVTVEIVSSVVGDFHTRLI